jgi:Ca2+-binding RTX toxin-like protein
MTTMADLGINELNYAMGTFTRNGQKFQMSSPDLDADTKGIRVNVVPQGVLIEASDDRKLSLLVTRIDNKTAVEPGRDGVAGIEDVEILINGSDLLTNDLLGGFSGREITLESLTNFRHGNGFIDPNGVVHFQPEADYDGNEAGFDYIALASNGQIGKGTVDISLESVNDAPTLGSVDNETRPIYGYSPLKMQIIDELDVYKLIDEKGVPIYEPWIETKASGETIRHDQAVAHEPTGKGHVLGSDVDDPASTLVYELAMQPQYGSVTLDADGAFNYISWKAPDTPSDRVLLNGQYAAWKDGELYNASNIYGRAVYPDTDAFQVKVTDPHGASSVVTVTVPHLGPYLPPTPPAGGGKKPISIDLDGDGFEFVNVDDSTIFYDVTGDGWKRRTSWIGKDDGILGYDIDGDGKIDKPGEIAFAPNANGAQTDLEGLAAFDTNKDGQFDANDREWSRFGIWQDQNQNGVTDPGEFKTLDQYGVQSVQLTSDGRFQVISGQTVHGVGKLLLKDGRALAMADVTLAFSQERQLPDGRTTIPGSPFSPSGDLIEGTEGKDLIPGRNGSDVIRAYTGDDVIIDDIGNDLVFAGDGNDTVFTGADNDFVDAGPGDDYVQAGLGHDVVFGGLGNDAIFLQQGNDIAFGGDGDDLIAGEEGNDVLSGDDGNDQLFGGDGTDALFGRNGNDQLYGMTGDDQVYGGDGNDLLDGGMGADSMKGGSGDDTYVVDDTGDRVLETDDSGEDSGGHDVLKTTLNGYHLSEHFEDLELIEVKQSRSPQLAYGNELANHISGNSEANALYGYGGGDLIDGGANADLMVGGQGNDTYIVDNEKDRVIELYGEGIDTVKSSISFTLPDAVENIDLIGIKSINATGNRLDNQIHGNAGANLIDGGLGADTMAGGAGDDVYRVDNENDRVLEQRGEGTDTVITNLDWRLGDNLENLVLVGSADLKAYGNELDNLLRGNRGSNLLVACSGNDTLIGAEGNDMLDGGDGNDVYQYSRGDGIDHVIDASGRDRIRFGTGITSDQVSVRVVDTGHGLQAQLRFIDANGDESKQEGIDIDLPSNGCDPVLPAIEDVEFADGRVLGFGDLLTGSRVLQAGPRDISFTGDRSDDIIYGNNRDNQLSGGLGNDALFGDGGYDTLRGGGGNDFLAGGKKDDIIYTGTGYNVVAFNRNDGRDTVVTSSGAANTLSLGQGIALSDLSLRRIGKDLLIDIGNKDGVTLKDWYASASNHNMNTLQLVAPANGKSAPLVTRIDFDVLAAQFDAANGTRVNSPWQVMKAKLDSHMSKGSMAIGDELAFDYAQHGKFDMPASAMAGAMYRIDPALVTQKLANAGSYSA